MRHVKTCTLVALLIATALPALAQYGEGGPPPGDRRGGPGGPGGDPLEQMLDRLDLDPGQGEEVRAILERHRAGDLGRLEREHRAQRLELNRLILDPQATEDDIASAASRFAAQEETVALARHRLTVDLATVLTPEQLANLQQPPGRGRPARRGHDS